MRPKAQTTLTPQERKFLKSAVIALYSAVSAQKAREAGDTIFADQIENILSDRQKAIARYSGRMINHLQAILKEL
ncbi:MAG: hypothetical protein LBQ75_08825 [Zoogloeaceae bacterium]|jgi:adenylate kinase|nr:hypothetical protein [Zoogloeaceae bacterium]